MSLGKETVLRHEKYFISDAVFNDSIICYGSFNFFVWKCYSAPKKAYAAIGICLSPFPDSWQQENASQNTKCQVKIFLIKVVVCKKSFINKLHFIAFIKKMAFKTLLIEAILSNLKIISWTEIIQKL